MVKCGFPSGAGTRDCVQAAVLGNLMCVKSPNVDGDQLAIIRIEGMHCHRCEQTIQKALLRHPGVHEVEVDFNSAQASVLYDGTGVTIREMMKSIDEAGYQATGFTQLFKDATC